MKKIGNLILSFAFIAILLTSCSKDDDNSVASIVGKWEYSQEGAIINGQEILQPYNHTSGCSKDYVEFKTDGTLNDVYFDSNVTGGCISTSTSGTYVQNGSAVTATIGGETNTAQILSISSSSLKVKFTLDGAQYVDVYTKAAN